MSWTDHLIWILIIIIVISMIVFRIIRFRPRTIIIKIGFISFLLLYICILVFPFIPQPRVGGMFDANLSTPISEFGWITLLICSFIGVWIFYYQIGSYKQIKEATRGTMNTPYFLLTIGNYGRVRHPLYANELIIYTCLCCGLNSPVGILIVILIYSNWYYHAILEEKKQLIPKFGEEYQKYKSKVKSRFFNKINLSLFSIPCLLMLIGIVLYGVWVP
ncbi:MAG: methyltransferase family protein [Candidatus Helarchaeota archaeon]